MRPLFQSRLREQALYDRLLAEKDARIALLERELADARSRCVRLELAVAPRPKPLGSPPKAVINPEGAWPTYLANYIRKQEQLEEQARSQADGTSSEGRTGVHEPSGGNGAQRADGPAD